MRVLDKAMKVVVAPLQKFELTRYVKKEQRASRVEERTATEIVLL